KSAVGAVLRELGADYADADLLVHALLSAGSSLVPRIVARFGPDVLGSDGGIDRPALAKIVFADKSALRDLEALVHPAVRAALRAQMAESAAPVFVVDAIKLIEGVLYGAVDSVW